MKSSLINMEMSKEEAKEYSAAFRVGITQVPVGALPHAQR
jgi:hypothetical protein